jgi:hypothetical protein
LGLDFRRVLVLPGSQSRTVGVARFTITYSRCCQVLLSGTEILYFKFVNARKCVTAKSADDVMQPRLGSQHCEGPADVKQALLIFWVATPCKPASGF